MHAATLAQLTKNAIIFWEHEVFVHCCHSNTAIYIFFCIFFSKNCENNGKNNLGFNLGFLQILYFVIRMLLCLI